MKGARKTGRGHFFQVERCTWERACTLGVNAAVAYLVLACGTGFDNRTSAWSVHAIETYTRMGRDRAKAAVETLIRAGLVRRIKLSQHPQAAPRYELLSQAEILRTKKAVEPHWIWLPNTIITGVSEEAPPVVRVRSHHDIDMLRLFIILYDKQTLADDGGIPPGLIRNSFSKRRVTERGHWVIWAFGETMRVISGANGLHCGWPVDDSGRSTFWAAWTALHNMGLLECVPHLFETDTDEGAMIMPCPLHDDTGTVAERALGEAANMAALALAGDPYAKALEEFDYVLPVQSRFSKVELVGVYRLRYRAKTREVGAWIAKEEEWVKMIAEFESLAGRAVVGDPLHSRAA